jgi:hypothetical protein
MKKLFLLFAMTPLWAFSQNTLDGVYRLNFAIPDLPAFKALGTEPSNLLRPSNTEDFTFVSSGLTNGKQLLIPNDLAIEVCPLLIGNKYNSMTLSEFRKKRAWATSRLSVGTTSNPDISPDARSAALGYRISLINKGDARKDTVFLEDILKNVGIKLDVKAKLLDTLLALDGISLLDENYDEMRSEYADNSLNDLINKYNEKSSGGVDALLGNYVINEYITQIKNNYKDNNWNAEKFDVALAGVWQSRDSLLLNVRYGSFSFWATYARPVGIKGQLMLGANYRNLVSDIGTNNLLSVSTRYYHGSNGLKAMLEGQYEYYSGLEDSFVLLNSGAEINIKNGIWLDLSFGWRWGIQTNSSDLVTRFRFRYSLSDKSRKGSNDCCPR